MCTIMLVDSPSSGLHRYRQVFEEAGYLVVASDSRDLLTTYQSQTRQVNAILIDPASDGANGAVAYQQIRASEPSASVVLLSEHTNWKLVLRHQESTGMTLFAPKSISPLDLLYHVIVEA